MSTFEEIQKENPVRAWKHRVWELTACYKLLGTLERMVDLLEPRAFVLTTVAN